MELNSLSEKASKAVAALRQIKVGTGSLVCFGCGHEDDCSIHGCAVMRDAAELIETLQAELTNVTAERDAALSDSGAFLPGASVWVVERDECREPCDVAGYMLLAVSCGMALVSPYINDLETVEETLHDLMIDTWEDNSVDLCVFPLSDCYISSEEAQKALDVKRNGQ